MHRIPKPADGYDLFDCPGSLWEALQKLGESYGWRPAGTLPASYHSKEKADAEEQRLAEIRAEMPPDWKEQARKLDEEAKREESERRQRGERRTSLLFGGGYKLMEKFSQLDLYSPRDWGGIVRMVTADDGRTWAEALDRALRDMETLDIDLPHEGPGIINENMHVELNELMNGGLKRDFIRAFNAYIRRGAFGFAWDD